MSFITINKQNFFHNLDICSKQANGKDKIAIVLKDNAYGHGLIQIASLANQYGLTKAVVQNYQEAQKIEKYFTQLLILADTDIPTYSHKFHITINNIEDIEKLPQNCKIHIKIDTGMHRNGINLNQLESAVLRALNKKLQICGVFTHHKSADLFTSDFFYQNSLFKEIKDKMNKLCEKLSLGKIQFHSCNSAALFRTDNFTEDFARIGIAAYGYSCNQAPLFKPDLKPILSLYANKISTRLLKKGQSVGYGGNFTAPQDMQISTYDIGYGDGFARLPQDKIYYTKDNEQILGNISMDNLSVHSTQDTICIFDDATKLANLHNTIVYEILTPLRIQNILIK